MENGFPTKVTRPESMMNIARFLIRVSGADVMGGRILGTLSGDGSLMGVIYQGMGLI